MMCLLFLYNCDEKKEGSYRLIIANNRDEFWDRPTKPAAFWENNSNMISGLDQEPGKEGGSWLVMSKNGKLGVLLNVLDIVKPNKRGRGFLATDFLTSDLTGEDYISQCIQPVAEEFNFFNLILLDLSNAQTTKTYFSNMEKEITDVKSKILAVDNGTVTNPWLKSGHGKKKFEEIIKTYGTKQSKDQLVCHLTELLNDLTQYKEDKQLRKQAALTNLPEDIICERSACNVFSPSARYGTRTNTIILVDHYGECEFIERTMKTPIDADNIRWEVNSYKFNLNCHKLSHM